MGKSKMNGVDPMQVIAEYGADARCVFYELFMGPLEQTKPWQMEGLDGIFRFLSPGLAIDRRRALRRALGLKHQRRAGRQRAGVSRKPSTRRSRKSTTTPKGMRFNTAISQMMVFVNEATAAASLPKDILLTFARVLSPYAPHLAEEIWQRLAGEAMVVQTAWPQHDETLCAEDMVTVVVQVNGKLRERLEVERGVAKERLEEMALESQQVQRFIDGKPLRKVIVVPDRLVNIVV